MKIFNNKQNRGENAVTTETTKNEENCDTSEDIVFDAMKEEYEHCVKRSEKLDNKIYILLTVCAFIFVLLTSIIEKASTFQMSQDMTKISLIIIYWLLLLVDVVIFCVLLEKLVVLLGSIEFQRLDINNIMELNIIEKNPRTAVKYIGANYMQCVENNHTILEKRYEVFNTCVRFLVLNVLLSLSLSFVCVFILMK